MKKKMNLLRFMALLFFFSTYTVFAGADIVLEDSEISFLTEDDFKNGILIKGTNVG